MGTENVDSVTITTMFIDIMIMSPSYYFYTR